MFAAYRAFLIFALLISLLVGEGIFRRAIIEIHGVIRASDTTCVQPLNNRCSTIYHIWDGRREVTYVAGFVDYSLPLRLPVGTIIEKKKWRINYSMNNRMVEDFPITQDLLVILFFLIVALGPIFMKLIRPKY